MALLHFIKEVTARLTGDEKGVIAAKNARKAESAVNGQLAALKAKLVDDEGRREDKAEALNDAKYPKTLITDNQSYVGNIKRAQEAYESAVEEEATTNDSIDFFNALLVQFENGEPEQGN